MNNSLFAGLLAVATVAALPIAQAAEPAPVDGVVVATGEVAPSLAARVPIEAAAPKADPRFAAYCLRDTGSVIVAMQNRRAERIAKANGTTPKLRCTGMGVALRVNADGVPVPDQGQPASRMR
jgi:hypothetical protein